MLQCLTHDSNLVPSSWLYVPLSRPQLRLIFLLLTLLLTTLLPVLLQLIPLVSLCSVLFVPSCSSLSLPSQGTLGQGCHVGLTAREKVPCWTPPQTDTEYFQEDFGIWIFLPGILYPTPELSSTVNPKQLIIRPFRICVLERHPAFPKPSPVSGEMLGSLS